MRRGLLALVLAGRLFLAETVRAQSQAGDCGLLEQFFSQSNLIPPWQNRQCCGVLDPVTIRCDGSQRVIGADLSSIGLVGTIPSNIRQLTQLQALSLANNNMVGLVPNLTTVSLLTDLNLSGNNFSGNVDAKLPQTLTACDLLSSGNSGMFSCQKNIPSACLPTFFEIGDTFSKSCRLVNSTLTTTRTTASTATATRLSTTTSVVVAATQPPESNASGTIISPYATAMGGLLAGICLLGGIAVVALSLHYCVLKKDPRPSPPSPKTPQNPFVKFSVTSPVLASYMAVNPLDKDQDAKSNDLAGDAQAGNLSTTGGYVAKPVQPVEDDHVSTYSRETSSTAYVLGARLASSHQGVHSRAVTLQNVSPTILQGDLNRARSFLRGLYEQEERQRNVAEEVAAASRQAVASARQGPSSAAGRSSVKTMESGLKGVRVVPSLQVEVVSSPKFALAQASTPDITDTLPEAATAASVEAEPHWFFSAVKANSSLAGSQARSVACTEDEVFIVNIKYDPESRDEVALAPGDRVRLTKVCADGWGSGHNLTTGRNGFLPIDFLDLSSTAIDLTEQVVSAGTILTPTPEFPAPARSSSIQQTPLQRLQSTWGSLLRQSHTVASLPKFTWFSKWNQ